MGGGIVVKRSVSCILAGCSGMYEKRAPLSLEQNPQVTQRNKTLPHLQLFPLLPYL